MSPTTKSVKRGHHRTARYVAASRRKKGDIKDLDALPAETMHASGQGMRMPPNHNICKHQVLQHMAGNAVTHSLLGPLLR